MDYDALMLDPIYAALGTEVTFKKGTEDVATLVAIDKTSGVEVGQPDKANVRTVFPALAVKAVDVTAANITPGDLVGCTVTVHGTAWKVYNHGPVPGFKGEMGGQHYLYLRKA